MNEYSVIGKSLPRVDGVPKACGEALFTFDLALPGMLYAATLRSPYAHARILNLDTRRAERLPGVKAVITGQELVGGNDIQSGVEYGLAVNNAHYVGEGVAAVAAIDVDTALEALDLIDVAYDPLPGIFDLEEALREDAPRANTDLEDNIIGKVAYHWGDADEGFSQCDHIRQDRFTIQSVSPGFLEPFVGIASFDASGRLMVWDSTQNPQAARMALSQRLGIRLADVRVNVPYVGGGFCGKTNLNPSMVATAVLSRKSGKPVKMALSREEVLIENRGNYPALAELKTGVKKDGTLIAMECRTIAGVGPYLRPGIKPGRSLLGSFHFTIGLALPYRLPNIRFQGYAVHTNNQPSRSTRGGSITSGRFASEAQLDMIAIDLGLDPIEIRRKNALQSGDTTANKNKISTSGLSECLQKVAERTSWRERRGKPGNNRGLGVACYAHSVGPQPSRLSAGAFVHLQADGTVAITAGAPEQGQGITTVIAQIVAEILGLPLEDIRINEVDTQVSPFSSFGSTGSTGTYTFGHAVKAAAEDARRQILQLAAETLGTRPEVLEMKERAVCVKVDPERRIPLSTLARDTLYRDGKPILGKGYFTGECEPPNLNTGVGDFSPNFCFGTVVAEVEVDRETGQVKVVRGTVAHDIGFALNPMLVEGQIEGQFQAAMGQAICEERLTEKGHLVNPALTDYRMPISLDMPRVESILVETIDPTGPFGAKECGEGPTGGVAPAIANAIYDAVGVRINDLPITTDKVLKALKEEATR